MFRSYLLLALTLVGIAAWQLFTFRPNRDRGDDSRHFFHHAKNFAADHSGATPAVIMIRIYPGDRRAPIRRMPSFAA